MNLLIFQVMDVDFLTLELTRIYCSDLLSFNQHRCSLTSSLLHDALMRLIMIQFPEIIKSGKAFVHGILVPVAAIESGYFFVTDLHI